MSDPFCKPKCPRDRLQWCPEIKKYECGACGRAHLASDAAKLPLPPMCPVVAKPKRKLWP